MSSLQSLDTKCLRKIFKICSINSQLNLLKTCEKFKECVKDIWTKDWKELKAYAGKDGIDIWHNVQFRCFDDRDMHNATLQDLETILAIIHPHVEELHYHVDSENMLELLQKYPFANLRSLNFGNSADNDALKKNPRLIYKLIVAITKWKLKALKLDFYEGPELKEPSAKGNFSHLSELEELVVNEHEIVLFRNAFNFMPNLKRMSLQKELETDFEEVCRVSDKLAGHPSRKVVELKTFLDVPIDYRPEYITTFYYNWVKLRSIRKLTVGSKWRNEIFVLAGRIPWMNEFVLFECKVTIRQLMHILIAGQQLDSVEIKQCWTYHGPITLDVDDVMRRRQKPITINVHNDIKIWTLDDGQQAVKIQLNRPTEFIKIVRNPTPDPDSLACFEYTLEPK